MSIEVSPVEKIKLTGQDLLDSFTEEYYFHYPDNVLHSKALPAEEGKNPRNYYKDEDFETALQLYLEQIQSNPNIAYINFYAAMSAYNVGEYDLAIKHFDRAQSKFPEDQYTLGTEYYEGLCYLRKGEVEKCKAQMNKYLALGGSYKGRCALLFQDLRLKWEPQQAKTDSIGSQP